MSNWITYEEVVNAANTLWSNREAPSIVKVREILGRGSNTIIQKHLKKWREDNKEVPSTLPDQIIRTVSSVWDEISRSTDEKIAAIQEKSNKVIVEFEELVKASEQQCAALQEELMITKNHLLAKDELSEILKIKLSEEEKKRLITEESNTLLQGQYRELKLAAQEQLAKQEAQHRTIIDTIERNNKQLHDTSERKINEIAMSLTQERQYHDEQMEKLIVENKALSNSLAVMKEQAGNVLEKVHFLETKNSELQQQTRSLQQENTKLQQTNHEAEKSLATINAEYSQIEKQLHACQQLIKEQQNKLMEYSLKIGQLEEKFSQLQ